MLFSSPLDKSKISGIAKLYRHNIIDGNTLSTQDAWALAISESYGVDITDYFAEWGITVSDSTKLKIQQNNSKNVFLPLSVGLSFNLNKFLESNINPI